MRYRTICAVTLGASLLSACASVGRHESGTTTATVAASRPSTNATTMAASGATSTTVEPSPTSAAGGAQFTMPDEVGRVLQAAQDDIQRVSHDPVFYTSSKDATGRGRHQILDRDWKVCRQNVLAGRVVERKTVLITFSVVKLAETCP